MRSNLLSSLVLGTYSFLGLCVLDIKAEVSVGSHPSQVRQSFTSANRAQRIDSNPSPPNAIRLAGSNPKIIRRARQWTAGEEQRLLELRDQKLSWKEIKQYFPDRTWRALARQYYELTRDLPTKGPKSPPWTDEELKILSEQVEMDKSWEEITELLPGRTKRAIMSKYYSLRRGSRIPEAFFARWTAEEDELLQKLEEEGVPMKERMVYFEDRTLRAVQLRSRKFKPPPKQAVPGAFTTEEDELMIEALEEGMPLIEISELLGRTRRGLRRRIQILEQQNQLDPPPEFLTGSKFKIADFELMSEMRREGKTWKEITKQFPGRSKDNVNQAYLRYQAKKERDKE